jgi:glycerophosphoryl diester phosphodiesterase
MDLLESHERGTGRSRLNASWLTCRPVAHRGLHDAQAGIPEGSLAAFERAAGLGIPAELDVRLLSDNAPVVSHDARLDRAVGTNVEIASLSRASLGQYRLIGSDERIPLLEEVLEMVDGRVPLLIEIKNDGRPGELERRLLMALRDYRGEFAVQSFNPRSLSWFRAEGPEILRGQIAGDLRGAETAYPAFERYLLLNLMLNRLSMPDFIAYDMRFMTRRALRVQRERGVPTLIWVVRSEEDERVARRYCDNVIFEGYMPS